MDDLASYFTEIMADARETPEARKLAEVLYFQWTAGLVPSPKRVKQLRKLLLVPEVCGKLHRSGSCTWLRKHYKEEGLRPPQPGERVFCHRKLDGPANMTYQSCTGYRRRKDNEDL